VGVAPSDIPRIPRLTCKFARCLKVAGAVSGTAKKIKSKNIFFHYHYHYYYCSAATPTTTTTTTTPSPPSVSSP
jgi:hypothetical protein